MLKMRVLILILQLLSILAPLAVAEVPTLEDDLSWQQKRSIDHSPPLTTWENASISPLARRADASMRRQVPTAHLHRRVLGSEGLASSLSRSSSESSFKSAASQPYHDASENAGEEEHHHSAGPAEDKAKQHQAKKSILGFLGGFKLHARKLRALGLILATSGIGAILDSTNVRAEIMR